jgi:hypothetical protein
LVSALAKLFQHEPDTPCEKCGDAVFVGVSILPSGPKVTLCPCSAVVRRTAVEAATHAVSTYDERDEALREAVLSIRVFLRWENESAHGRRGFAGDWLAKTEALAEAVAKIESSLSTVILSDPREEVR